jgi:hypothetical protein
MSIFPEDQQFAKKGSQRWLQMAVNLRPEVLNAPLRSAMRLPAGAGIEWLSPLRHQKFVEYRDGATLDYCKVLLKRPLHEFWPAGGPVWDGLAKTEGGDLLLVEAKAHIPEIVSGGTRASGARADKIRESLTRARNYFARNAEVDWSATFYQYANRLAHLHFLREDNGVPAHLVFIYFLNAGDVNGPRDRAEWEGAIKVVECYLGIRRTRLQKYVHKLFIDVRDLAGADAELARAQ